MLTFHHDNLSEVFPEGDTSIRLDVPIPKEEGIYTLILEYGSFSDILTVNIRDDHVFKNSAEGLGIFAVHLSDVSFVSQASIRRDYLMHSTFWSVPNSPFHMLWIPQMIAPLGSIQRDFTPEIVQSLSSLLENLKRENAVLRELLDRPDALGSKLAYDEVVRVIL